MAATKVWGVALTLASKNRGTGVVEYDSYEEALVASNSYHLWDRPLVVSREVSEWCVQAEGEVIELSEAIKRLERKPKS